MSIKARPLDDRSHARQTPARTAGATTTREGLIELAADLFAEHGYIQTSIRDIARRGALTSGAIYGNFRNKADLLAAAINKRTRQQLEGEPSIEAGTSHVETLRMLSQAYPRRRQLRALILQGAAAAETDPETRDRLREEQLAHLDGWVAGYEAHRERLGIDPAVDLRTAVLYTWAAEVGLGILEALGIEPTSTDDWADMAARCGRAMTLPSEPVAAGSGGGPVKSKPRKTSTKR